MTIIYSQRIKEISGDERDCFSRRTACHFREKPGRARRVKKAYNKRTRYQVRRALEALK